MSTMAPQTTGVPIICSTVCWGANQRTHQRSASLVTGGFPSQRASNAENALIWWRHHVKLFTLLFPFQLQLNVLADTRIGKPGTSKALSGGERKRLSFASEVSTVETTKLPSECIRSEADVNPLLSKNLVNVIHLIAHSLSKFIMDSDSLWFSRTQRTRRNNNVIMTSKPRRLDVIITLLSHHVPVGN